MKKFSLILLFLLMPMVLWAQVFKVVELEGDVRYRAPKSFKTVAVLADQELEAGGRIKIKGGKLVLTTPKQDRIELSGDTYMRLEELSKTANGNDVVKLELFKGVNLNKVNHLQGDAAFTVRTPTAVVGVRGTEFQCAVAESGITEVNVLDGLVAVQDIDAQFEEVSVAVGKSATITSDGTVNVATVSNIEARIETNSSNPGSFEPQETDLPNVEDILGDVVEEVVEEIVEEVSDTRIDAGEELEDSLDEANHSESIPDEASIETTIETINR